MKLILKTLLTILMLASCSKSEEVKVKNNISDELKSLKSYISLKTKEFSLKQKETVKFIQAGYDMNHCNCFLIYFNTSKEAGPDGEWTLHMEKETLDLKSWPKYKKYKSDPTLSRVTIIGELIKQAMIESRDEGIFKQLDLSKTCEFGVEYFGGEYGWPNYEDRGKENYVNQPR
jgi:hypothetical protein